MALKRSPSACLVYTFCEALVPRPPIPLRHLRVYAHCSDRKVLRVADKARSSIGQAILPSWAGLTPLMRGKAYTNIRILRPAALFPQSFKDSNDSGLAKANPRFKFALRVLDTKLYHYTLISFADSLTCYSLPLGREGFTVVGGHAH